MTIEQARPEHAKEAAVLMYDAIHEIAHSLTGETEDNAVLEQLEDYFRSEGNRLSYENCLVKMMDGKAVGLVLAYHGKDADELDAAILDVLNKKYPDKELKLDSEADPEDYYIDTVSVNPEYGGNGIGTALLEAITEKGKELGHHTISLNVDEDNPAARRLYERLGFKEKKQITIIDHTYAYMVKKI
ncbi:GNAT family N-acetyltransferase [Bacillus sp. 1P06AnD]|uniref:GNAT family N-acetyltransferase n=1 Tax=Bacillus sp. 1P06AnD TaxID=3132208 RepID=UPI0039A29677